MMQKQAHSAKVKIPWLHRQNTMDRTGGTILIVVAVVGVAWYAGIKFAKVKGKDRRYNGSGSNKRYYEWDHTHNDIEVYDSKGKHLGSIDPKTGNMYKEAVNGRRIKL